MFSVLTPPNITQSIDVYIPWMSSKMILIKLTLVMCKLVYFETMKFVIKIPGKIDRDELQCYVTLNM